MLLDAEVAEEPGVGGVGAQAVLEVSFKPARAGLGCDTAHVADIGDGTESCADGVASTVGTRRALGRAKLLVI